LTNYIKVARLHDTTAKQKEANVWRDDVS